MLVQRDAAARMRRQQAAAQQHSSQHEPASTTVLRTCRNSYYVATYLRKYVRVANHLLFQACGSSSFSIRG